MQYMKNNLFQLENIIFENQKFFKLCEREALKLNQEIRTGELDNFMYRFRSIQYKLLKNNGELIDGRPIGLGCVSVAKDILKKKSDLIQRSWSETIYKSYLTQTLLYYMINYDLTILSHGYEENGEWKMWDTQTPDGIYYNNVLDYIKHINDTKQFPEVKCVICNPGHLLIPETYKTNIQVLFYDYDNTPIN